MTEKSLHHLEGRVDGLQAPFLNPWLTKLPKHVFYQLHLHKGGTTCLDNDFDLPASGPV